MCLETVKTNNRRKKADGKGGCGRKIIYINYGTFLQFETQQRFWF